MTKHEAARAARQEFAAFLNRLKQDFGIERKRVAQLLGVKDTHLSRMAADEVPRQPTYGPPADWRKTLSPRLREMGVGLKVLADELAQ